MIAVSGKKKHMWRGTRESKPYLLLFRNLPSSLDQGRQRTQRLGQFEERMLEQFRRRRSLLCVNLERLGEVVCKHLREILRVGDLWRAVGGDEVECLERVLVQVRRLALDHFCMRNVRRGRERKSKHEPMAMMPRLQMSTLGPYAFRVTTSGAIQYGVPTMVVRLAWVGSDIWAQKPKSAVT